MGRTSTTPTRADLDDLRALLADPAVLGRAAARARGRHRRRRSPPRPPRPTPSPVADAARRRPSAADADPPAQPPHPQRARGRGRRRRARPSAASCCVTSVGDDGAHRVQPRADRRRARRQRQRRDRQTDSGWRIEIDATRPAPPRRRPLLPGLAEGRRRRPRADRHVQRAARRRAVGRRVTPAEFSTLTVTEEEADGDQASSGRRVLVGTIDARSLTPDIHRPSPPRTAGKRATYAE